MNQELMQWLGKQAAESFILPPRKRSSQTRTFKIRGPVRLPKEEEQTTAVQSPHRYGRKPPPSSGATNVD